MTVRASRNRRERATPAGTNAGSRRAPPSLRLQPCDRAVTADVVAGRPWGHAWDHSRTVAAVRCVRRRPDQPLHPRDGAAEERLLAVAVDLWSGADGSGVRSSRPTPLP